MFTSTKPPSIFCFQKNTGIFFIFELQVYKGIINTPKFLTITRNFYDKTNTVELKKTL